MVANNFVGPRRPFTGPPKPKKKDKPKAPSFGERNKAKSKRRKKNSKRRKSRAKAKVVVQVIEKPKPKSFSGPSKPFTGPPKETVGPKISDKELQKRRIDSFVGPKQIVGPPKPKEQKLITTPKGQLTLQTAKEFAPIINRNSQNAYSKIKRGNFRDITKTEAANVAFDIVSIIPVIGWVARGGVTAIRVGNAARLGSRLGVGTSTVTSTTNKINKLNPKVITSLLDTGASIIRDVGFGSRSYNAAQEYLKVDNKLIDSVVSNLDGFRDDKTGERFFKTGNDVYKEYINTIHKNVKILDKKIEQNDLYKFLGVDATSKKRLLQGQREYLNFLTNNGVSKKKALRVLQQLENKRRARVFGQIVGAIKIEVSSEKASQRLLALGVGKKKAVAIGGVREGLAFLSSEAFIQDYKITPGDLALAVFGGAVGSIFFSKSKFKKLSQKKIDVKINSVTNKINNKLSPTKKNKYVTKAIKNSLKLDGRKATTDNIKTIKSSLTSADKNTLSKQHIKESLKQGKLKKKISTTKAKRLLRDPIANIIDPFEMIGDPLYDLGVSLKRKLGIKTSKRLSKIKKGKVRAITKSKTSTKTKTKSKGKAKSKTKTKIKVKAKAKSKTKTKIKAKAKAKSKTKTKIKAKAKAKSKTKTKTKTKSKTKTKTKTKTKSIQFLLPLFGTPLPKGTQLKFNAYYKSKGKFIRLKLGLPLNKAYKRVGQLIDRTTDRSIQLRIAGVTKVKDIKKPSIASKFGIRKSKNKKVLILVEKTKHIIDTKGEKRGLTVAKLLKKKKTPKKIKKVVKKSIKRKKKSLNKPSKRVKHSKR